LEYGFSTGNVDGICGANTVTAIKGFQERYGLTADGICGTATWTALENNFANRKDDLTMSQYTELLSKIQALEERTLPRYNSIPDIPSWASGAISDAMDRKIIEGESPSSLGLSHTDLKACVMDYKREETNTFYKTIADVPSYFRDDIQELIDMKIINGDGAYPVAKRANVIEAIIVSYRALKHKLSEL